LRRVITVTEDRLICVTGMTTEGVPMAPVRSVRASVAAAVMLLAVGCGAVDSVTGGSTPSPTPATNGVADKPPAEMVALAKRAFEDTKYVRVQGHGDEEGVLYALDMRIKGGTGTTGGKGTLTLNHNTAELLRIGKEAYVKGDAAFWSATTGNAAAAELLKGKYLKGSTDDKRLKGIVFYTDVQFFAREMFDLEGTLKKGERRTIRGVETIGVETSGKDAVTLFIATTGRPLPMQLTSSGTAPGGSILDFLDYDKQFDLKPPPADLVIDTSKLGR
jgi:hypothetical protein